ncbi:ribosomal-processing cysteine protease Prp [Aneurinibacillus uraniidurans]|uniref:ribosomal-processing cysteine protease Prp n=1 Tax=Aneurinibacillus uraniidurans TaxID=2966586 RepID=UPI00234921D0|nr:ribosomal-processing cysteine protease Prp [Aneurinibacillus sp. B1]WCN38570.1 ribosomal-processing cysteine protease Prp [Aneurinibacillus sp. B1]
MITVQVKRRADESIYEIKIRGHAGSAEHGQDLVCAAVSAISLGSVNAVEMVLSIELPAKLGKSGFLHLKVPDEYEPEVAEKVQLLLEGMIASLRAVEMSNGAYVRIQDTRNY